MSASQGNSEAHVLRNPTLSMMTPKPNQPATPIEQTSDVPFQVTRRHLLTGVGALVASAMIGLPGGAQAGWFSGTVAPKNFDFGSLPSSWALSQGTTLTSYAQFLGELDLDHIKVEQIIASHAKSRGGVWNTLPPKNLWKNIVPTLKAVDKLSGQMGTPVEEIVSVYRSPAYNARCPGAKAGSFHKQNVAADIRMGVRPSLVGRAARLFRSHGGFAGGVGTYPDFTHIDTRGSNADW